MSARVTRHFVTVGRRRVHYTRAGEGPPVVLLHASPCSAKVLSLPQQVFAATHTAIAFDTPGFGLSDLLPLARPEIEDFADALAETLEALGIARTAVYGRHTGAAIAVEFAARHPQRCAMALTDGYPTFSPDQQAKYLDGYLLPIVPSWDGAHLLWLWFRYRDQHVFWPWNAQDGAHRADTDVPDADFLHRGVVELLEAGDDYRIGYAAAFRHRGIGVLPELRVPVCFGGRPGDSLFRSLAGYPPSTWVQEMPRDALQAAVAERGILATHTAPGPVPPPPACAAVAGRSTTDYVDLGDSQIFVRSAGDLRRDTPILVLHHVPGSSALYDPLVLALGADLPVIAPDLPGHGESEPPDGFAQSVDGLAERALRMLDRLGISRVHLYGHLGGAAVAVALTHRAGGRIASVVLDSPPCLPDAQGAALADIYAPSADPEWDGSHLLRVWHHLRDQELWWPWFDRRRETARSGEPRIAPEQLNFSARECLKQPRSYHPAWRAVLSYPLRERLAMLGRSVAVMTSAQDLFAHCADDAASLCAVQTLRVADDWAARATAVRMLLASEGVPG